MKQKRRILISILSLFVVTAVAVIGGADYLLNYALCPGNRSRNETLALHQMDSLYPGLAAWHNSLIQKHSLRDTTIQAADGARLHAYYIAAPKKTQRTAVLIHGYTDCAMRMMHLARMYRNELNANVLLPDLRYAGRSEGDHFGMGWTDRLDLKEWVRLVPQIFGDTARVVVHGVSMGAATAMMLAGEPDVPLCVQAYVEDCGYTSVYDEFAKELRDRFSLPPWPLMPAASALCRLRYGWNFREASALEQVQKCSKPMLFIHGTADTFVPTTMVFPLYRAHKGPKQLWLAPKALHAQSYRDYPNEYARRVRNFAEKYAGW